MEIVEQSRAKRAESINLNSKAILTNHPKWLKLNKANRNVRRFPLWIASVEIQQIQLSLLVCRHYILLCQYKNLQFIEKHCFRFLENLLNIRISVKRYSPNWHSKQIWKKSHLRLNQIKKKLNARLSSQWFIEDSNKRKFCGINGQIGSLVLHLVLFA